MDSAHEAWSHRRYFYSQVGENRRVLVTRGERSPINSWRSLVTLHRIGTDYLRPRRSDDPRRSGASASLKPARGQRQIRSQFGPTRRPESPPRFLLLGRKSYTMTPDWPSVGRPELGLSPPRAVLGCGPRNRSRPHRAFDPGTRHAGSRYCAPRHRTRPGGVPSGRCPDD
jgi:hypothetical protein